MDTKILNTIEKDFLKVKNPNFRVGDIIEVYQKVKEGDKVRTQLFKGIVISIKGSGTRKMFTIRKISYGVGVEKIFPFYSPNITKIKIIKRGKVKKSKLYYIRKRIGRLAMKTDEGEFTEGEITETEIIEKPKNDKKEETSEEKSESEKKTEEIDGSKPKEDQKTNSDGESKSKDDSKEDKKEKSKEESKEKKEK